METMESIFNRKLSIPTMLEEGLRRGGENVFVIYQRADGSREEYSYAALRAAGERLAARLEAAGLKKGDRLGIVSALRPWWYALYYAAVLGGYRMVCIDPGLPVTQIHSMLRQTEIRALFTSLPNLKLPANFEGRIPLYDIDVMFPLREGAAERVDALLGPASPMPEDAFFVLFSSGTTGERRKCVLLPQSSVADAIEWHTASDGEIYKNLPAYSIHERDLMLFPPYHIAGLLCATFDLYCNTQVLMLERLTPHALMSVLQELQPDNICTVPGMLTSLMKKIRAGLEESKPKKLLVNTLLKLSGFLRRRCGLNWGFTLLRSVNKAALGGKLRSFMIGASPCDEETMRFFLDCGIDVALAYGLTELGAPLACTGKGYYLNSTGRVNRHGEGLDIRIVNPDENGRGEVEVLSPFRMTGYLPEEDMEGCFTDDGYFKTGDLGWFNEENCLVIAGRAKEAIVLRNGEKLLPEEIEAHYENIDTVSELCAFRVPDEGGCDAFSLAVIKDKARGIPDESVRDRVLDYAAVLEPIYRPREVYVLSELPRSSTQKVQRFRLTEMAKQGLALPVTEGQLKAVENDGPAEELRSLLVQVGGPQWKTAELTEGLPLDLDSLSAIDLFVAVQEHFGVDLFDLAAAPETFGALLEAVTCFDEVEKNNKEKLDLSLYPLKPSLADKLLASQLKLAAVKYWNVHGKGMENIPREGNYLICSNHITTVDPAWILYFMDKKLQERTACVGKASIMTDKKLRVLGRAGNMIPVDRTGNSMETLDRCRELLGEGWNVIIFPEGTNYEGANRLLSFREGPARLAIAAGVPVLPVRIKGVTPMDPLHPTFLPPRGGEVEIVYGQLIEPGEMTPAELNEKLREAILAL
ncbi:MAG: AMP-binding protein [Oscillospiraceae bacterium]|nr:AMP-binding protein [Oscillospiraceae bacterium]